MGHDEEEVGGGGQQSVRSRRAEETGLTGRDIGTRFPSELFWGQKPVSQERQPTSRVSLLFSKQKETDQTPVVKQYYGCCKLASLIRNGVVSVGLLKHPLLFSIK